MRAVYFFTKKECLEGWRTARIGMLVLVFLILGIMNPFLAKFLPEIIRGTMGEAWASTIPAPTSLDSWTQFYKNVPQIGLVVLVLMSSGTISQEINNGTLVNLITKGLKRQTVVLSKALTIIVQWSICLMLTLLVTWGYTLYYFSDDQSPNVLVAVFPLWVFGVLLMSLVLLASAVARNSSDGLLLTGGFVVVLFLIQMIDKTKTYNPLSLATENLVFLKNTAELKDYWPAFLLAGLLSALLVGSAVLVMNKKRL
ncbi:ABC transporter permease [Enterococcus florum]|uniref:ABC transporter permease n=1 Tax=Enterococcus florum TaxID=2480627 RepID=A0A4P5P4B4_9ENTE|nr:ABC transporter permease subunit [Enterococcus florum]GCF92460.1 ABC transporter permease [Enterococcus florum]